MELRWKSFIIWNTWYRYMIMVEFQLFSFLTWSLKLCTGQRKNLSPRNKNRRRFLDLSFWTISLDNHFWFRDGGWGCKWLRHSCDHQYSAKGPSPKFRKFLKRTYFVQCWKPFHFHYAEDFRVENSWNISNKSNFDYNFYSKMPLRIQPPSPVYAKIFRVVKRKIGGHTLWSALLQSFKGFLACETSGGQGRPLGHDPLAQACATCGRRAKRRPRGDFVRPAAS